jgi:hypothetical protein
LTFKNFEADEFLKANNGGMELLEIFLINPTSDSRNSTQIEVCSFKYPYKEFAWLFTRIIGQESMAFVPKYIVYILYHSIHEDVVVDWA